MKDIHCSECNRFLCKYTGGQLEIKCPNNKCKHVNKVKVTSYKQLLTAVPEPATIRA